MRTPLLLAALVTLGVTAAPRLADACSLFQNENFVTDPQSDDVTPPGAVTVTELTVERYWRMGEDDSCDDFGTIELVVAATDDRAQGVGYQLAHASGVLPGDFVLPIGPIAPGDFAGHLFMYFDPREAVDFELAVRAVDRAGNLGEPTIVRITSAAPEPDTSAGCSAAAGASGPAALALVLLAALRPRRRHLTRAASPRR